MGWVEDEYQLYLALAPGSALIACLVFILTIAKIPPTRALGILVLAAGLTAAVQHPASSIDTVYSAIGAYMKLPKAHTPPTNTDATSIEEASSGEDAEEIWEPPEFYPAHVTNLSTADGESCVDARDDCKRLLGMGRCHITDLHKADLEHHDRVSQTLADCPRSCGTCHMRVSQGGKHLLKPIGANNEPIKCSNKHVDCEMWASQGECAANPSYMTTSCAQACHTCYMLDYRVRCRRLPEHAKPAVQNGDIDKMFERLAAAEQDPHSPFHRLQVKVLSKPPAPWVVQFDRLLTPEDADAFTNHTYSDMEVSSDAGAVRADGSFVHIKSESRTSWNSWCKGTCLGMEATRTLAANIESITGVPESNSEFLQVLRYQKGQYYKHHHDFIHANAGMPCGVRVYTLLVYLNNVDKGGETKFDTLNLKVTPRKGRALLWASVRSNNITVQDPRTDHQALPVKKGVKYAINAWLHTYNFRHYYNFACTG